MENNENNKTPCECMNESECCGCVGYAYVPVQMLNCVYEPCDGLSRGTIFPELDLSMSEYGKVCKGTGGIR